MDNVVSSIELEFVEVEEALGALLRVVTGISIKSIDDPNSPLYPSEKMKTIHLLYAQASEPTKYKILDGLIDTGFSGARWLLLDVLANEESPLLRHEAAFGLGILKGRSEMEALTRAMLHDPHEIVRHEAAIALAEVGDEGCLPALERALEDVSGAVVDSARYASQNIQFRSIKQEAVA